MLLMRTAFAAVLLLALTACGGTSDKPAAKASATSAVVSPTPTETPAPPKVSALDVIRQHSPKGYPHLVAVSSLPDQVRSSYDGKGNKRAVAVAPGVWAELPPGATMVDAITAETFDGFCASVKAWERKYWKGYEFAGECW